jgi:hypothetical protein
LQRTVSRAESDIQAREPRIASLETELRQAQAVQQEEVGKAAADSEVDLRSQIERAETASLAAGEEAAALKTQLHDAQSAAPELVTELQQERAALEEELDARRARGASYIHLRQHGEAATSRGWRRVCLQSSTDRIIALEVELQQLRAEHAGAAAHAERVAALEARCAPHMRTRRNSKCYASRRPKQRRSISVRLREQKQSVALMRRVSIRWRPSCTRRRLWPTSSALKRKLPNAS